MVKGLLMRCSNHLLLPQTWMSKPLFASQTVKSRRSRKKGDIASKSIHYLRRRQGYFLAKGLKLVLDLGTSTPYF